jgi:hypothetical protein
MSRVAGERYINGDWYGEGDIVPADDADRTGTEDATRRCKLCGEFYDAGAWHYCPTSKYRKEVV